MNYLDLRSDTCTHPTKEMKEAFMKVKEPHPLDEIDPEVLTLEKQAADIFGMEAAAFVPCGIFANQCAIFTHTNPGDEIFIPEQCHMIDYQAGGLGMISKVIVHGLKLSNEKLLTVEQLMKHVNYMQKEEGENKKYIFSFENPTSSGRVYPLQQYQQLIDLAKEKGLTVHIDGARIFNAATCLNVEPKILAKNADSLMFCLSKALCAPLGSLIMGSRNFIKRFKKKQAILGGIMENLGRYAAMGLVSLRKMRFELYKDHEIAKSLANRMQSLGWVEIVSKIEINMIFFKFTDERINLKEFQEFLFKNGVKVLFTFMPGNIKRMVTHNYIRQNEVEKIINLFKAFYHSLNENNVHEK